MTTETKLSHRLDFLMDEIQLLKNQHLYQTLRTLNSRQGVEVIIDGKPCINFSSNNYLGLTSHPQLIAAAKKAIDDYGVGTGSVRTIIGTMDIHQMLEQKLAEFKKTEATLVFQSGFCANQAAINSVMSEGDIILSDELNHASIIDACRLAKGVNRKVYWHKNMTMLEELLASDEVQQAKRILIVTDGVFSMDGDITPLPQIVELAEKYNAIVMVDDAHASGVLGRHGSGTTSHFNLYGQVDIQVGTLSKAIGAMGGYVAGTQALRDIMINRARPFLFSTAHPPSIMATCIAALALLQTDENLHKRLWENTNNFKAGLRTLGFAVESATPIVPILCGTAEKAQLLSQKLYEEGIFGQAIVFPTVPKDKARVRMIITAAHTQNQIDRCLETIARLSKSIGIIP